ncbi:MAG TPA: formate--tetrahydrofolate ligase, partial [Acidimicrobiales bacterium]|nr:formate--tetrahydrofolate ligase [Acidimicrobiales bacterium]
EIAASLGVRSAVSTHFRHGGAGAAALAEAVIAAAEEPNQFRFLYPADASLREKIETIATRVYGADGIDIQPEAGRSLDLFEANGLGHLPICIAKTHLSISSDPKLVGAPVGWRLPVREVRASAGAGFIYAICGDMRTMPGLGRHPAAEQIDIDENGDVIGLY